MKNFGLIMLTLSAGLFLNTPQADENESESANKLPANFFQQAPHWVTANNVTPKQPLLSVSSDATGSIIATPFAVSTNIEDTSSHIMSSGYYSDKIVNLEFMLSPESSADILLMGRYAVRLSLVNNTKADFTSPGAIAPSWNEWDKNAPNRTWAGSIPSKNLKLAANTWHSFSATFRAPRHDQGHNKVASALIMSVVINGQQVQQNYIAEAPSRNATFHWEAETGPLSIDAVNGQAALRNISISRAEFSQVIMPKKSAEQTNEAQLVNLVEQGKQAFNNHGCIACHSASNNDKSVKTGPNLFGLFTREPRKRTVQNQEKHQYQLRADSTYLQRSIRNSEAELAIAETGNTKGQAYLPIMPRYNEQVIPDKDITAIYAFLLSRNDVWQQGPLVRLEPAEGPVEYKPMQDVMQFLVQDRVRIQRGPMPEVSGRAIHVGHPNAVHYSFDPRFLSVAKIWQGGFLETSGELTGRGGKGFQMGYQATELNLGEFGGLIRPYNGHGKLVDFSFKEPKFKDYDTLKQSAYSDVPFADRIAQQDAKFKGYYRDSTSSLAPVTFFYSVSHNEVGVTHSLTPEGRLEITLSGQFNSPQKFALNKDILKNIEISSGKLVNGTWVLGKADKVNATLTAKLTILDTLWKAPQQKFNYEQQEFKKAQAQANLPPGYSIEDWFAPKDNAGREQLFEAVGLDTIKNGDILVSTRTAGVWKKSGNNWKLFAEGIFDSLGVLNESDDGSVAAVSSKAELTRIRDINGDGIADYYDTLFDAFTNGSNYHTYTHGPVKDKNGDYILTLNLGVGEGVYHTAGGNVMGSHGGYVGWAVRVSPKGEYQYFANGLRSPAGLGSDLAGNTWYADNQGDFVGSSKIFKLEDGKFYGHPAGLIDEPGMTPDSIEVTWPEVIKRKEKAVIVVPHGKVANSLGNPVWDHTKGGFGPYQQQMFIGDQTQSSLTRVITEQVKGQWQGAMIPFASGMESGVMRPVFLHDNSMLLGQTGRGWQSKGGSAAALQRIIYDGSTLPLHIQNIQITEDGFNLTFTKTLPNNMLVEDIKKGLSVTSWTYRDAPNYGSEEMGLSNDKINSVALNQDKTELRIVLADTTIPAIHPQQTGRIYHIKLSDSRLLESAGTEQLSVYYSAHRFR